MNLKFKTGELYFINTDEHTITRIKYYNHSTLSKGKPITKLSFMFVKKHSKTLAKILIGREVIKISYTFLKSIV